MEDKNPIQVAGRLFDTLELLSEKGSMGLTQIGKILNLNKSTVHRILNSLIYMGYVRQNENNGKYEPSFKIVALAGKIMQKTDIVRIAHPYLQALTELSNETVHFVRRDDLNAVYIDKVESYANTIQLVSRIGKLIPLFCSGVGKAMLSQMPDPEILKIWERSAITQITPNTITDFEKFMDNIKEIRSNGYAVDNEENESGVRCIAASVTFNAKASDYAFSISAPVSRMSKKRISELSSHIIETKRQLEKVLGF